MKVKSIYYVICSDINFMETQEMELLGNREVEEPLFKLTKPRKSSVHPAIQTILHLSDCLPCFHI